MQAALEQVAAHCSAELEAYARCVDSNPDDWTTACAARQKELNACSAKQCARTAHLAARRCRLDACPLRRAARGSWAR